MVRFGSRTRSLAAVTAFAALLPLAAGSSALAADGAAAGRDASALRGRAGKVIAAYDPAAGTEASAPSTTSPTTDATPSSAQKRTLLSSTESGVAAGSTAECGTNNLWADVLTDRMIVHAQWGDASTLTLMRKRNLGAWVTLATYATSTMTFNDQSVSPRVPSTYRMVAKSSTGSVLMDCESYPYYGAWTDDGWGYYDAVIGHPTALVIQGVGSFVPTPAVTGGPWVTPAFSADGRLVAATRINPDTGVGVLEVLRSRNAAPVFSVDLGPDVSVADPAFSYDGQTLAYSRYDTVTGAPLGLGFVDVHGSHAQRELNANVPVAEPAWRPNGTLVVSTFDTTGGLANLCATCTTVSPIPGTTGGYTSEVGADNSLYFTVTDATTSYLNKISASGSLSTLRSSTTDSFISPRVSPSGRLFVERDAPNPSSPDPTVTIIEVAPSGAAADQDTWLGAYSSSAYGYDIRQPFTKGTSQLVAEAHDDLVVRDGYGKLWAYRNTNLGLGSRTQIGSGWSSFTAVLAVGDVTSDDRSDLLGRDANGKLWLYRGVGGGKFGSALQVGSGWNGYTLVAPGDWDGDDQADLMARDASGYLWLYPGTGTGRLGARRLIGSGWGAFNAILGSGDANFDNKADLITRDGAGRLWMYPGNGKGGFLAKRQIGSGWGGFTALTATEVTNQHVMIWARTSTGQLVYYTIAGDGSFVNGQSQLGYGWNGLLITS